MSVVLVANRSISVILLQIEVYLWFFYKTKGICGIFYKKKCICGIFTNSNTSVVFYKTNVSVVFVTNRNISVIFYKWEYFCSFFYKQMSVFFLQKQMYL